MRLVLIIFACTILVFSCNTKADIDLTALNGYWEIVNVKKDGKIVMEYKMSPIIDYWQLNDDDTGFRKKVMPNLQGKMIVTQHSAPFTLDDIDGTYTFKYDDNGAVFEEELVTLTKELLIIENKEGLHYTYKPYEQITLENVTKE